MKSCVARGARATVTGRVLRVRKRRDGSWRIRLTDTGGALAAGEIRLSHPLPLPRVGASIVLRGTVQYDDEHRWYAIDPVEIWFERRPASPLFPS